MSSDLRACNGNLEIGVSREHYAHLAKNALSEQSLRKIYVRKVGIDKEMHLIRFVENVDLLMSGHADDSREMVIFDGLRFLGHDVVFKYLIGLKDSHPAARS